MSSKATLTIVIADDDADDRMLVEDAFMESRLHRQNILRMTFRHAAIGVVRDDDGHFWVTVIFYG